MILRIVSLPPLKIQHPAEINIDRTILYGPNGAGKSIIMKTIFSLINNELKKFFRDNYIDMINVSLLTSLDSEGSIEIAKINNGRADGVVRMFNISLVENDIAYIKRYVSREKIDIKHNFKTILRDKHFMRKINSFLLDLEIYDKPYSHGIKRAIMILYAIENSDIILIEGFENNLHIDTLGRLFEYIDECYKDRTIVIETHNSFLLKLGVLKGWSVYYIDRNLIKKLDKIEDLRDLDIFRREVETIVI
jgi:ABC-type lipoprotein export system ATPase subunit